MMNIRPISDLRNKFAEIERAVKDGNPVYLTKNGYGTMVVLSIEEYSRLVDSLEMQLSQADYFANNYDERMSHNEVFDNIRKKVDAK